MSAASIASTAPRVLLLPGWQNSGDGHWQTRWEMLHGFTRVQQHDWMRPLRGDWMLQLEEAVLATPAAQPIVLVAHSLGCILTAWWAAHSAHTGRVRQALLVAPPDIERDDLRELIPGWTPVARQRLPFAGTVVASTDDPYGSLDHAALLAQSWGSTFLNIGARGHINAESGLGNWPEGLALIQTMEE